MLSLTRRARPGRSCFLYRNSLPHPAKPVKHFYAILQKIIPTSQSASQTAPLIGEPLAGRASPAVRVGPMGRKAAGPVLFGSGIRTAAVNLGSGARPFPDVKNFARSAQSSPTRQRLPYQGSWRASARLRGFFIAPCAIVRRRPAVAAAPDNCMRGDSRRCPRPQSGPDSRTRRRPCSGTAPGRWVHS